MKHLGSRGMRSVPPRGSGWVRSGLYQMVAVFFFLVTSLCLTAYSQEPAAIREPTGPIVKLPFMIVDSKNQLVDAVKKEELQVIESNLEQKILTVERDERPIDIAIAIDSTGSFRDLLPYTIEVRKTDHQWLPTG